MSQDFYEQKINKIVEDLNTIYKHAPQDILEKYEYLFYGFINENNIKYKEITLIPESRAFIKGKDITMLTPTQAMILSILLKMLSQMDHVPKRLLYSSLYYRCDLSHVNLNMHIYLLNKRIKDMKIRISNRFMRGLFMETMVDDNPFDWKPY